VACEDRKLRDPKFALIFAEKAIALDPNHVWARRVAAAAHQDLGDLDSARRLYDEFLKMGGKG
jgi:hypothetical protein